MSRVSNLLKVILLILAALCGAPLNAYAVCMACWNVHGVTIGLRNGQKLEGYILWNEYWVDSETKTPLPGVLLEPLKAIRTVEFHQELHRITYPVEGAIVSSMPPMIIQLDSLKSVVMRPDSLDRSHGAGNIPVVSTRAMIERLKHEKPVASCKGHYQDALTDVYWVSYNPSVDEETLAMLCNEPWIRLLVGSWHSEANGLVRLDFPYD